MHPVRKRGTKLWRRIYCQGKILISQEARHNSNPNLLRWDAGSKKTSGKREPRESKRTWNWTRGGGAELISNSYRRGIRKPLPLQQEAGSNGAQAPQSQLLPSPGEPPCQDQGQSHPPHPLPLEKKQSPPKKLGRRGSAGPTQKPRQEGLARMSPPPNRTGLAC